MNKNKKAVMKRAWNIAREGFAKFGGKVNEYLSAALKQAWLEDYVEVSEPVKIVSLKTWFVEKNFSNEQAYAIQEDADFTVLDETLKAYRLKISTNYGTIFTWAPKSVCLTQEQAEVETSKWIDRFEKGLKRNIALLEEAKALGIKGVRKGMRTATLEKKIAEFKKGA